MIEYYERASEIYSDGAILDLVSLNNRANAFRELGQFEDAGRMLDEALTMARGSGSALLQARVRTNIAVLNVKRGDLDAAEAVIEEGFALTAQEEAAGWAPFVWGAQAQLLRARNDLEGARAAVEKAFEGADLSHTPAPFRDFHETAYLVFDALGQPSLALPHLAAFKRLDDHGREIAASANLALMNAEFETSNKELQIARLRAEQLEKDAALSRSREVQQRLIFGAVTLIVFGGLVFFIQAYASARRAQAAAQRFGEELETKNTALSETNLALEEANQAKLEFLAVTSHEIRTPLNAIIGLSDVVLNAGTIEPHDREYLQMVNDSGRHLLNVVNDILDVSKLESGQIDIHREPMDVTACVTNVAEIWRKAAEDKGLSFNVELGGAAGTFIADDRLVRQVVSNLISNAIKFTKEGRVDVRLDDAPDTEGFRIVVSDTGIGIAPEHREKIFEAFRQADGRLQRNFEGTGLGLAICRKIVEALGGTVVLTSEVGAGSSFEVIIPADRVAETGSVAGPSLAATDVSGAGDDDVVAGPSDLLATARVLVAEDNPTNALVLRAKIDRQVASITVVENGADAVEAVKTGAFDLVLMDKQMPVMDGVAATRAIRELPAPLCNVPIVAVTADAFEGARDHVLKAGMDGFVSKPLDDTFLTDAMCKALAEGHIGRAEPRLSSAAG